MSADSSPVETCSPSPSSLSQQGVPRPSQLQRRPNRLHSLAERPLYASSNKNMAGPVALLSPQPIHTPTRFPDAESEGSRPALSLAVPSFAVGVAAAATAAPPQPQRPKLSLNTAATPRPRSFGRGNTGLRLDTLSNIASPTARNTFHNTYNNSPWPGQSPHAASTSGLVTSPTSHNAATPLSPVTANNASSSYSSVSSSSSSSSSEEGDASLRVPYAIPLTQRSILRNSPLPRSHQVMTSTPTSSTPRARLFPPSRRVTFAPAHALCQEISTSIYLARHQDLLDAENQDETDADSKNLSSSSHTPARRSEKSPRSKEVHIDPQLLAPEKVSNDVARIGDKRESSSPDSPLESSSSSSGDDDDSTCPKTPIAGRAKRRREWVWTLGPIPGTSAEP